MGFLDHLIFRGTSGFGTGVPLVFGCFFVHCWLALLGLGFLHYGRRGLEVVPAYCRHWVYMKKRNWEDGLRTTDAGLELLFGPGLADDCRDWPSDSFPDRSTAQVDSIRASLRHWTLGVLAKTHTQTQTHEGNLIMSMEENAWHRDGG